ncbi:MAG: hypothetical protein JST18_05930 [Bacteroidetes bacterium]|nr:hypothetical protein [Bacteroidota bacterium]
MEILFKIFLAIHIAGGTLALLGAPMALFTAKGKKAHRRSGIVFFHGMTLVFISAVYMSIAHHIPFLFMVAIFSYQMVLTGRRTLRYKTVRDLENVAKLDWLIVFASLFSDLMLVAYGGYLVISASDFIGIVGIAFGAIGLQLIYRTYRRLSGHHFKKSDWLFEHIGNMIGGYIAAVTAFLVVNIKTDYPLLLWLTPTVAGSGVIAFFIWHYKTKIGKAHDLKEVLTFNAHDQKVMIKESRVAQ